MLRRVLSVLLVIVLIAGVAAYLVYRNGVHPKLVLWVMKTSAEGTQDLDGEIEAKLSIGGFPVTGVGHFRMKPPSLYDLDFNTVRVVTGPDALWVVVPAVKTALRVTGKGLPPIDILKQVVSGWDGADPQNWARDAQSSAADAKLWAPEIIDGQRCWVLEWPARTGERVGGVLYVSQLTRLPVRFEQKDSTGHIVNTFHIKHLRRNVGLKPEDFAYKPMEGYVTIDYTYDPEHPLTIDNILAGQSDAAEKIGQQIMREAGKLLPIDPATLFGGGR